ncbi:hypothetical protein Ancab_013772 [Ancistrocladus abbreviatus]
MLSSSSLELKSREEDGVWLKECWYGEVYSIEELLGLECKMKDLGVVDCSIHYLGGKGMLLSSNGSRDIRGIVAKHTNELNQWFALIRLWEITNVENGRWVWFMVANSYTKVRKRLESARILLHTSCMGEIKSIAKIQVDGKSVSIRATEEATLIDGNEVLCGFNGWHPMFSVCRSYVEDSMIGLNTTSFRAPAPKEVVNCQKVDQSGEGGSMADLSITLQKGNGVSDAGAGKGFSRGIFEFSDGYINYELQGANSSSMVIPNSSSTQKEKGEKIGLIKLGRCLEIGGLKKTPKEVQLMQAENNTSDNSASTKSPGEEWNSLQSQGQWNETQDTEADKILNAPEKASISISLQPQIEKRRNRGERKKTLEEILQTNYYHSSEG